MMNNDDNNDNDDDSNSRANNDSSDGEQNNAPPNNNVPMPSPPWNPTFKFPTVEDDRCVDEAKHVDVNFLNRYLDEHAWSRTTFATSTIIDRWTNRLPIFRASVALDVASAVNAWLIPLAKEECWGLVSEYATKSNVMQYKDDDQVSIELFTMNKEWFDHGIKQILSIAYREYHTRVGILERWYEEYVRFEGDSVHLYMVETLCKSWIFRMVSLMQAFLPSLQLAITEQLLEASLPDYLLDHDRQMEPPPNIDGVDTYSFYQPEATNLTHSGPWGQVPTHLVRTMEYACLHPHGIGDTERMHVVDENADVNGDFQSDEWQNTVEQYPLLFCLDQIRRGPYGWQVSGQNYYRAHLVLRSTFNCVHYPIPLWPSTRSEDGAFVDPLATLVISKQLKYHLQYSTLQPVIKKSIAMHMANIRESMRAQRRQTSLPQQIPPEDRPSSQLALIMHPPHVTRVGIISEAEKAQMLQRITQAYKDEVYSKITHKPMPWLSETQAQRMVTFMKTEIARLSTPFFVREYPERRQGLLLKLHTVISEMNLFGGDFTSN